MPVYVRFPLDSLVGVLRDESEEEASARNSGEDTRSSDSYDDSEGYFTIGDDVLNTIGTLLVGPNVYPL